MIFTDHGLKKEENMEEREAEYEEEMMEEEGEQLMSKFLEIYI